MTLKQFENMSKTWLGFPTALNQIGLKYEEVEKRLREGKEPFDDEEAVKNRCEEKLQSLVATKNRILEAKSLRTEDIERKRLRNSTKGCTKTTTEEKLSNDHVGETLREDKRTIKGTGNFIEFESH